MVLGVGTMFGLYVSLTLISGAAQVIEAATAVRPGFVALP